MAIQFQGKQVCSRCGKEYEWGVAAPSNNDKAVFSIGDPTKSNVKKCVRINMSNKYSIELGCPECGCREYVEKSAIA